MQWHGSDALTLLYRGASGRVNERILCPGDEPRLDSSGAGAGSFDRDGTRSSARLRGSPDPPCALLRPVLAVLGAVAPKGVLDHRFRYARGPRSMASSAPSRTGRGGAPRPRRRTPRSSAPPPAGTRAFSPASSRSGGSAARREPEGILVEVETLLHHLVGEEDHRVEGSVERLSQSFAALPVARVAGERGDERSRPKRPLTPF